MTGISLDWLLDRYNEALNSFEEDAKLLLKQAQEYHAMGDHERWEEYCRAAMDINEIIGKTLVDAAEVEARRNRQTAASRLFQPTLSAHNEPKAAPDRLARVEEDILLIRGRLGRTRQNFSLSTRNALISATHACGGKCPCCQDKPVVTEDGNKTRESEFDHFFANHIASIESGWLICKECHVKVTNNANLRRRLAVRFCEFQDQRESLTLQPKMHVDVL